MMTFRLLCVLAVVVAVVAYDGVKMPRLRSQRAALHWSSSSQLDGWKLSKAINNGPTGDDEADVEFKWRLPALGHHSLFAKFGGDCYRVDLGAQLDQATGEFTPPLRAVIVQDNACHMWGKATETAKTCRTSPNAFQAAFATAAREFTTKGAYKMVGLPSNNCQTFLKSMKASLPNGCH